MNKQLLKSPYVRGAVTTGILGAGLYGVDRYRRGRKEKEQNPIRRKIKGATQQEPERSKLGVTASNLAKGAALSKGFALGRSFVMDKYARNQLARNKGLTPATANAFQEVVNRGGALGQLRNDTRILGNVTRAPQLWNRIRTSPRLAGGLALGAGLLGAGAYGYKKAKDYYFI